MKTKSLLTPPRYFSHENLEFGNIIKLNFEEIEGAIGYLIEVSKDDGINFSILGYSKDNTYIDYSITTFSDYNKEYNYIYRVASISNLEEVPSNFSKGYKVVIPKKPSELEFSVEGPSVTHSEVFNIFNNKEDKVLIQNIENNLEIHKTSTLNIDPDKNITKDYILSDSSNPIEVKNLSDDFGFYIRYSSGTIQYINKTTLTPYITLNTYGKKIKKFEVNEQNNLICLLEILDDGEVLNIYKKENILIKQIIFSESELRHKKILDFKIKNNILYVLDETSQFYIYEIDIEYGVLKFVHSVFNEDGKQLIPFNIFKKKSYQLKNNIINYFEISKILNSKEKENLKFNILNNELHNKIYDEITKYIKECSNNTTNNYEDFKSYINLKLNSIFILITQSSKNSIDLEKLNLFFNNYLSSELHNNYVERIFYSLQKYYNYEKKYLNESKIIISETNNIIIIQSCYYIYFLDLFNYRINEYFNCLLPIKEIENIFLKDYNINSEDEIYKSILLQNNDRFIYDVKYFSEKNNIGIYFEDISSNFILNEQMKINIDNAFSYQYIDFYNIDFEGNYTNITLNNIYNEKFTSLKGFGYEYIQKYSNNTNILESTIYVHNNKFYKCIQTIFFFDRQTVDLDLLLSEELSKEILIEINKDEINHFSLNTRLYITSKFLKYNNRNFSFHNKELTNVYTSDTEYTYLNDLNIFNNNLFNHSYVNFHFDSTGDNVFIYNNELNYYDQQIKCLTLFLTNKFYLESNNIIFEESINTKHFTLAGKFNNDEFIPTSDPFNFLCFKKDFENNNYVYLFDIYELTFANEQNSLKLKTNLEKTNFFLVNALYKKKNIINKDEELRYFFIYNEHQENENDFFVYGNSKKTTWRWKRNNDLLKYDSYLSIRVSVDKENWNYFNKDINSYTNQNELNDGIHTFYLQYQDLNGNWSKTMKAIYHLKTLKPSTPILEEILYDKQDKGKPLFKWYYDPEIIKYKITYDNIEYYPITTNYHSPDVSFNKNNQENLNIDVSIIAYDKYGNTSEELKCKFIPNNNILDFLDIYFNKTTNNNLPLIRWKNKSFLTIKEYHYSFDNQDYLKTEGLFCYPENELSDGLHYFNIYALDSLGQKTDVKNIVFEVKTENPFIPVLKNETIERTKNCNLNNLYFNFELDNSNYNLYYSFDNFKNSYEFKNYYLDLTHNFSIKEGNNTIYFKYIDVFNNESEILEYVFSLNSKEIKTPIIQNTKIFFIDKPYISWTKNNNIKEYEIILLQNDNVIFEEKTINNFWNPLYSLKNNEYTFKLTAIDFYGNKSQQVSYNFIIDNTIPNEPEILEVKIQEYDFYLKVNKIINIKNFYRIKKVEQLQNSSFQSFDETINIKNLKSGNYILELKSLNNNNISSNIIKYNFIIIEKKNEYDLNINNSDLSYVYDKINNELKIISYKDFNKFKFTSSSNINTFNIDDIEIIEGD